MIQKCIEANPAKFAMYAKVATVIGWILLIASAVLLLHTLFQYNRIVRQWHRLWFVLLQTISPAIFGMFFLLLAQFLKYELGLEKQPGWFFRNGSSILRIYAAVVIGGVIFQYALYIVSLLQNKSSFRLLLSMSIFFNMINIAKALLLWALAGVVKMMMDEIRNKGDVNLV